MTTFTKLLPSDARPAAPILERASVLVLTTGERAEWGDAFETPEGRIEVKVEEHRPLQLNDVFVDEKGGFWVVRPGVETIYSVTGDLDTMREAAAALISRGVRVGRTEEGFSLLPSANIRKMLEMIGLSVEEVEAEFDEVVIKQGCCGGHGHGHGGGCGCGGHGHGHDHEHGEGSCGCGGHGHGHDHDHEGGSCGCSGEGHGHGHEGGCGCGGHHDHDHEHGSCGCGGHGHGHEHGEGGCGCGGHHDHDHECECGGQGHGHNHEGGCGCGGHHDHDHECGCGGKGHGHGNGHGHGDGSCGCSNK